METQKLRPLDKQKLYDLIRTARGEIEADIYIQGGTVINVYSGELIKANVAIKGRHIAYVGDGDAMVGDGTRVLDAAGMYLCPGYIEPHAHPFQTYNPITLVENVMTRGTTTLICDNLFFFMLMDEDRLMHLWRELAELQVKLLWSIRLDPQTYSRARMTRFAPEGIKQLLDTPLSRQVGELTDWPSLVNGHVQMLENILAAGHLGKRVEGHAPGASMQTLNMLAAGGVSACHESITGEEALRRLRLGIYATLRHSSLRPDLPGLIKDLLSSGVDLRRTMVTTDGVTPPSMGQGFTDHILRVAMQAGLPPMDAYRMATINPAVYYGLDDELGGIAPGRLADVLFLTEPTNPTPVKVLAEGALVAEQSRPLVKFPEPRWQDYNITAVSGSTDGIIPHDLVPAARTGAFPVMQLVNPVITRRQDMVLPAQDSLVDITGKRGLLYATLLDRKGSWVCSGILGGFADDLAGLACSNTITGDILALGRSPGEMLLAVKRMFEMGGGVVLVEKHRVIYELPLPLGGIMSPAPVDQLIEECSTLYALLAERGHTHYDLLYTLLFLSATHLPELRLSPAGILSVKDKKILVPVKYTGKRPV
ncbi:adenine deaminase C-terminal domain-containing protein [Desulfoscipio geothermicus]|uniref:adenine deaminase n=1 Tax=Desulfoscipio geothermicus DSM 3669 TaxID=1121426 RepID=A0A1I6E593_9FIRM|nr:adenine deaminase C-terminal domain-containing protein [Desulfoscipio geothermicus]SFR12903.1 adenine deaminase [Desulfoscipio geothermicus DSM 3669]